MNSFIRQIKRFISYRFNLQDDRASDETITTSIQKNVDFKGANLWALIFAIFIASIGLNVNSTAVIIGAMLISPIMGPVMGIGLGIGINDLALVKRGAKNLLVATLIGILASFVYFTFTPLHEARSELLARTSPSIWDVFIAFFGGGAGMVAASQKEKSNVIPGVAIATALMPPLCTAGFGLSIGNWYFFLGAIYLYFINSVFIAIAAFLISRYLKMHRKHAADKMVARNVNRYIIVIVIITIVPSVILAYRIVDKSIFKINAQRFVNEQFRYANTQVVSTSFIYKRDNKSIEILLIGRELKPQVIDSLKNRMAGYDLENVRLNIRQGLNARRHVDISQIKESILEDVFNEVSKIDTVHHTETQPADSVILKEIKILFPTAETFGLSNIMLTTPGTLKPASRRVAVVTFSKPPSVKDVQTLKKWLSVRYKTASLKLIVE